MSRILQFARQFKIELSGIMAWALFTFSAFKLVDVYLSETRWPYLITYNVCSLVYIWYFSVYYKPNFTFVKFLLLIAAFNFGIQLLDFSYNKSINIHGENIDLAVRIFIVVINFIVACLFYGLQYAFTKREKA